MTIEDFRNQWFCEERKREQAIRAQGKIMEKFLSETKDRKRFHRVMVRHAWSDGQSEMTQLPYPFAHIYFDTANTNRLSFHKKTDGIFQKGSSLPVVDAIVGHELSALWQNQNLIDALTGYYQPPVGHLQEI